MHISGCYNILNEAVPIEDPDPGSLNALIEKSCVLLVPGSLVEKIVAGLVGLARSDRILPHAEIFTKSLGSRI